MCWRTACSTLPCKDFVQKVDIFRDNFSVYSKSIFGENRCWRAAFLQWVADRPPGGRAHQHSVHCSAKEGYSSAQQRRDTMHCSAVWYREAALPNRPSAQGRDTPVQCRGGILLCTAKKGYNVLHRGYWLRTAVTIIYCPHRRDTLVHCSAKGYSEALLYITNIVTKALHCIELHCIAFLFLQGLVP